MATIYSIQDGNTIYRRLPVKRAATVEPFKARASESTAAHEGTSGDLDRSARRWCTRKLVRKCNGSASRKFH